ncbi:tellurite resistance/C4-dicarboxylate transporter family protein [Streptomyces sp. SHP 1-2]|uniref:tellurite resistance/C4-dicarboxylate transporter family protein n=1 Tax=Streptomyces sp. SHP 1-2 TaxID=2769489 RepID=UPI002238B872|nr:tellurite resistance/C4-dicarboxylate transporter family protein [Streptomyces sp. SHP 1-2]MCW5251568.1 tellurite resistance/C4-dicarboxylate transporter family protein [Streptomyces sp. SHP 1-2]
MSTTATRSAPRIWLARRPPAAGAAVMATGIVSVALHLTGHETTSRVVLALACAAWLGLAVNFVSLLLTDLAKWADRAGTPGALTAVAATTVVGTRFALLGWTSLAAAGLALAALLWPTLLVLVVRNWGRRMPGAVFLGCVATEGLAVLAATLGTTTTTAWLVHAALVPFWLGLVLYLIALFRFDPRQVARGAGDHWVAGGALAISTLAGAKLLAAARTDMYLWTDDVQSVLHDVTVGLLALDLAWYAVLAVAEVVWPRVDYDVRRWSTVFPLGMTAAATLSVSAAITVSWLDGPGRVLVWVAVGAWLAVAAGAVAAARTELRSIAREPAGVRSTARR